MNRTDRADGTYRAGLPGAPAPMALARVGADPVAYADRLPSCCPSGALVWGSGVAAGGQDVRVTLEGGAL